MKRRVAITLLSIAALGVVVWIFLSARESEPVYQGKPLRYWLTLYTHGYSPSNPGDQADRAVREIGTNAIPTLLEMLQEKDSPLKLKWRALLEKQDFIQPPQRASSRNYQAGMAFRTLGAIGSNAVPALAQIYRRKISFDSQDGALMALGGNGPAALPVAAPVLLDAVTNSDNALRLRAVTTIGEVHGQPEVFVPALIHALKDSNGVVMIYAVRALIAYGPDAKPAVPAVAAFLNDPGSSVHREAANALKAIDPVAAMPAFIGALKNSNRDVRLNAVQALARYGPDGKAAVPALVGLLNDPDPFVRREAAFALKTIDLEAAAKEGVK